MAKAIDLSGMTFGNLTALYKVDERFRGQQVWMCKCICGKQVKAPSSNLRGGRQTSCGCLHGNLKHGANKNNNKKHPLYRKWASMIERCENKNNKFYKNYGGRGIKVYSLWRESYTIFRDYVLNLPECPIDVQTAGASIFMTIDRINNNKNYEPGNIKWSTQKEQANNKTNNKIYIINEKEKMTLSEIVEKYGKASYSTIHKRLSAGWPLKKAVLTPA